MLRQNSSSSCINWQFLLVGLFFIIMQCDARAVNVSNTWTMPQEGLNVFYRFFRDRISWFEADAVCQFHHANLVTVDNSFQFDATRDLLRELDVNDIVWIGLMRPQSSDRFMWSNSRPLVADTGYWAESLPLMDAPLCAVIDPIRDYRWHALRCGGPETASFLCEMPVPSWADACNLKDMPNLTLQYMADTASIELIRNCQEEGLLRTMCRGKQDRERAMQDLICPRERLEAQRINDITNSHFKSLQIINSIPSDNNENNDIELLPMEVNYGPHYPSEELQTEKNTVQRLIEQFNVDELMQADEPSNMETISSFYKIPGLIPKPVKKSAKKVLDYPKKDNAKLKGNMEQTQKDKKRLPLEMEDMMMGDQPMQGEPEMPEQILNEEVSNEILEPLPHIKKTNIHKEDGMEKMEKEAIAIKKSMQKTKEMESKKLMMMGTTTTSTTTTTTTTESTTTTKEADTTVTTTTEQQQHSTTTSYPVEAQKSEEVSKSSEDNKHKHHQEHHMGEDNTGVTTTSSVISHPMHPQQPRSNVLGEESQHSHTKESVDSSHFIPPMLMVKSHYVPPSNKHEHHHQHHQQQQHAEEQLHIGQSTTEREHDKQNQTSVMMTVTTPKVLDLEKTTLKSLDSTTFGNEQQQQQENQQIATARQEEQTAIATSTSVTTESVSVSSIKPITEKEQVVEPTVEKEQRQNSKILPYEETTTTMTATTLQTQDSTTNKQTQEEVAATTLLPSKTTTAQELQTILSTNSEEINKNPIDIENESQELKPAQTTDSVTQTTVTAKREETTEKSLETTADNTAKDSLEIATTSSEHQVVTTEEKPTTTVKTEESKEHLQTMETTQNVAATTTTEESVKVITTLKTAEAITNESNEQKQEQTEITETTIKSDTEAAPSATTTETQSLLLKDKVQEELKEKQNEEKATEDKTETIVKTTEILETSSTSYSDKQEVATTTAKVQEVTEKTQELTEKEDTTQTSIQKTTTTTIKPITITVPQNEVTTTETSVSSTNSEDTTTMSSASKTTIINIETTSTILPPTTTTIAKTTTTTQSEIEKETTTSNNNEISTTTTESSSPSLAPETTRNFLKVTTEMPFKPNRRRSLTKPETVSYMKKILG